jgi:DNA-binding helix-hairpin-helix protein with protein kinase domain
MRVRLEGQDQEFTLEGPLLGRGGEASIYAVPGRADVAAKIYHNPTSEQADKLAAMLAAPPVAPPSPGEHVTIAWPIGRLHETEGERRVVGYLMPRLETAHLIWEFYNPSARLEICPQFHHGPLLRLARNLAGAVRLLHERGYVIGDLNESNVAATVQGLVTLIDVDSFQTPGGDRLHRCRVGRPDYTPAELQGASFADVDRRLEHDNFALAVLIFQLLMQGIHPFAGTSAGGEPDSIAARIAAGAWPYAWERTTPVRPSPHAPPWCSLPPSVQELLRCCFEDAHAEPALRPDAAQWQHALEQAEHELTSCANNAQHVYHRGLDRCPWCALARQQGRDPFPAPEEVQARLCNRRQSSPAPPPRKIVPIRPAGNARTPVNDPLPPRPTAPKAPPQPSMAESILQSLGAAVERRGWLVWVGVGLIGALVGLLYALESASPGKLFRP